MVYRVSAEHDDTIGLVKPLDEFKYKRKFDHKCFANSDLDFCRSLAHKIDERNYLAHCMAGVRRRQRQHHEWAINALNLSVMSLSRAGVEMICQKMLDYINFQAHAADIVDLTQRRRWGTIIIEGIGEPITGLGLVGFAPERLRGAQRSRQRDLRKLLGQHHLPFPREQARRLEAPPERRPFHRCGVVAQRTQDVFHAHQDQHLAGLRREALWLASDDARR